MHFSVDELAALAAEARERDMHIASLHGPCPVKTNERGERERWTDGLSSTNEAERRVAIEAIKRSVDAAVEVGARAIVVHMGNTGVASRQGTIFETIERFGRLSDEHRRLRDQAWSEREARKAPRRRGLEEHSRAGRVCARVRRTARSGVSGRVPRGAQPG
jgi:sugar phosphate isomerase/epimerase